MAQKTCSMSYHDLMQALQAHQLSILEIHTGTGTGTCSTQSPMTCQTVIRGRMADKAMLQGHRSRFKPIPQPQSGPTAASQQACSRSGARQAAHAPPCSQARAHTCQQCWRTMPSSFTSEASVTAAPQWAACPPKPRTAADTTGLRAPRQLCQFGGQQTLQRFRHACWPGSYQTAAAAAAAAAAAGRCQQEHWPGSSLIGKVPCVCNIHNLK